MTKKNFVYSLIFFVVLISASYTFGQNTGTTKVYSVIGHPMIKLKFRVEGVVLDEHGWVKSGYLMEDAKLTPPGFSFPIKFRGGKDYCYVSFNKAGDVTSGILDADMSFRTLGQSYPIKFHGGEGINFEPVTGEVVSGRIGEIRTFRHCMSAGNCYNVTTEVGDFCVFNADGTI
ncbi:MAG: hypothetical protein NTX03_01620 [Bacteroidetes bacterium]|nr:hypothetical protein [Bacteroidota bacterium]